MNSTWVTQNLLMKNAERGSSSSCRTHSTTWDCGRVRVTVSIGTPHTSPRPKNRPVRLQQTLQALYVQLPALAIPGGGQRRCRPGCVSLSKGRLRTPEGRVGLLIARNAAPGHQQVFHPLADEGAQRDAVRSSAARTRTRRLSDGGPGRALFSRSSEVITLAHWVGTGL